jgi:predicted transcriptional regulator
LSSEVLDIVISVREQYLVKILTGEKKVELRRRTVNVPPGSRVWFYAKCPSAQIRAYATVEQITSDSPQAIWRRYHREAGITCEEYEQYMAGASVACAIRLRDIRHITPELSLAELRRQVRGFHPPQFFKKLTKGSAESVLLRARASLP